MTHIFLYTDVSYNLVYKVAYHKKHACYCISYYFSVLGVDLLHRRHYVMSG